MPTIREAAKLEIKKAFDRRKFERTFKRIEKQTRLRGINTLIVDLTLAKRGEEFIDSRLSAQCEELRREAWALRGLDTFPGPECAKRLTP